MSCKVLEINVDDLGFGGVYSLVKNVIINKPDMLQIDIATIEQFEKQENVKNLKQLGTTVYYVGYDGNKLIKQIKCVCNLIQLIKREQYECLHIHADVAYKLLISALAGKIAGVEKIILHSHAAGIDGNHRAMKMLYHKLSRRILKFLGTHFVSCSDLASEWMFPNITSNQIIVVNNGIDLNKFRFNEEVRRKIRKELSVENKFVIGHVGRFAYQKNHEFLIEMFVVVRKKMENAKLLLIGEGPLEQEIREKVKKLGLLDDVIFYGTSNKVFELFQAMDVFVLPSHFEGLPIVGVEAQSAGLPVLFSDKITNEAKMTDGVDFLSIDERKFNLWCEGIEDMCNYERIDTYEYLKSAGFSIVDTVNSLLNIYIRR